MQNTMTSNKTQRQTRLHSTNYKKYASQHAQICKPIAQNQHYEFAFHIIEVQLIKNAHFQATDREQLIFTVVFPNLKKQKLLYDQVRQNYPMELIAYYEKMTKMKLVQNNCNSYNTISKAVQKTVQKTAQKTTQKSVQKSTFSPQFNIMKTKKNSAKQKNEFNNKQQKHAENILFDYDSFLIFNGSRVLAQANNLYVQQGTDRINKNGKERKYKYEKTILKTDQHVQQCIWIEDEQQQKQIESYSDTSPNQAIFNL